MGYVFLGFAILLEFIGTLFMKLSAGFSHLLYTVGTLICYGCCFYFLAMSLKTIPLNVAYATWGGLGILLSATVGFFYFHETITPLSLLGICLIVAGVTLCNFFGTMH